MVLMTAGMHLSNSGQGSLGGNKQTKKDKMKFLLTWPRRSIERPRPYREVEGRERKGVWTGVLPSLGSEGEVPRVSQVDS